ncbi:MAG: DUF4384 domain-containing protein [Saprospiraceae bacterium]|nr:DUF4384 domain-containing protein [Saprospiraceae bacterium]
MMIWGWIAQSGLLAQTLQTGLIFDEEEYAAEPLKKQVLQRNYENLPLVASLKSSCPMPQDQGEFANCVGWAVAYAARTILEAQQQQGKDQASITAQAFSPDFLYLMTKLAADERCQKGISFGKALKLLQEQGVPRRSALASTCNVALAQQLQPQASANRIEGYTRLFDQEAPADLRIKTIKKALSQQKPVVVGIECYESFKNAKEFWQVVKDKFIGGHALCVVGYDDTRDAFEVMNSWGTNWGNAGFTWIRYQDFAEVVKYAYELNPSTNQHAVTTTTSTNTVLSGALEMTLASGAPIPILANNNSPTRGVVVKKVQTETTGTQYQTQQGYPSGTRYRLYLTNEQPIYAYVLASDLTGAVGLVFPPDAQTSPYLSYAGNAIALPDESWYLEMDQTVGTDFLAVLYSTKPLDMTAMVAQLNQSKEHLPKKLTALLDSQAIPTNDVTYSNDRIAFRASTKDPQKNLVITLIAMPHL